jgi:hypothetical protein
MVVVDAAVTVADAVEGVVRTTLAQLQPPRRASMMLLEQTFLIMGRELPQIKCEQPPGRRLLTMWALLMLKTSVMSCRIKRL